MISPLCPRGGYDNPKTGMCIRLFSDDLLTWDVAIADPVTDEARELVGRLVAANGQTINCLHWSYRLVGSERVIRYDGTRREAAWQLVWAVLEARSPLTRAQMRDRLQFAS